MRILRNLLIVINLFLALGLVFAYLAKFVNPASTWLFAFFGLAYPVFLFANVFFLIGWLFVKKRFALLSFFVLLLSLIHI